MEPADLLAEFEALARLIKSEGKAVADGELEREQSLDALTAALRDEIVGGAGGRG